MKVGPLSFSDAIRMHRKEKLLRWETQSRREERHRKESETDIDSEKRKRERGKHRGIKNLQRTEISLNEHKPSGRDYNPA